MLLSIGHQIRRQKLKSFGCLKNKNIYYMRINLWNIYCLGNVRERVIVGDFFSCLSRLRDLVDLTTFLTAFCKMLTLEPNVKNTLWWQILYDGFYIICKVLFACKQIKECDLVISFCLLQPPQVSKKALKFVKNHSKMLLNKQWGLILTHSLTCKIIFNGGCRPIFHHFGF